MAKVRGLKVGTAHHKTTSGPEASCPSKCSKNVQSIKKEFKLSEIKEWDNANCSVCMEYPHNAVLLLCSSHHKGCRPYMCATSSRYSNCLEQYKEAYTKVTEIQSSHQQDGLTGTLGSSIGSVRSNEKKEVAELLCPLCRGQVKGWTVVEKARKYFNCKKRTCMQDSCSFFGNFREMREHVRAEHPLSCPRAVDPVLEEKWKSLVCEREREDVISTIVSSTPGAMVVGDYVIESPQHIYNRVRVVDDMFMESFFSVEPVDRAQNGSFRDSIQRFHSDEFDNEIGRPVPAGFAVAPSRSLRRMLLGRSRRRRRQREINRDVN